MTGMTSPQRSATEIGKIVRQLREQRGLTQLQLAARAGVTDTTVRSVEHASKAYHRATLAAIAAALGTTADDLRGCRKGPMPAIGEDAFLGWDELP